LDDVIVHKGGEELLSGLKNMNKKVGIISNCYLPSFVYKEIFIEVGLDKYIDSYTFSYDHKIRKPRHELYEKAFEFYDVPKKKMLMIGDGFKPDILGSSDVGIDAIWYNHKRREQKQKAMHLKLMIHQLDELL
jgi:putative hydrolase of the HAD superfamily